MSSATIWASVPPNEAEPPTPLACASSPSTDSKISVLAFQSRNRPPTIRMMSRHESSKLPIVITVAVRPMIHEMVRSSRIRMPAARPRPINRARSR